MKVDVYTCLGRPSVGPQVLKLLSLAGAKSVAQSVHKSCGRGRISARLSWDEAVSETELTTGGSGPFPDGRNGARPASAAAFWMEMPAAFPLYIACYSAIWTYVIDSNKNGAVKRLQSQGMVFFSQPSANLILAIKSAPLLMKKQGKFYSEWDCQFKLCNIQRDDKIKSELPPLSLGNRRSDHTLSGSRNDSLSENVA